MVWGSSCWLQSTVSLEQLSLKHLMILVVNFNIKIFSLCLTNNSTPHRCSNSTTVLWVVLLHVTSRYASKISAPLNYTSLQDKETVEEKICFCVKISWNGESSSFQEEEYNVELIVYLYTFINCYLLIFMNAVGIPFFLLLQNYQMILSANV